MTATKVKYEPRYKAGDWIVILLGRGENKHEVVFQTDKPDSKRDGETTFQRLATEEEISNEKTDREIREQKRLEAYNYKIPQPYEDATAILSKNIETLISKLGPEMLREIAEKLR